MSQTPTIELDMRLTVAMMLRAITLVTGQLYSESTWPTAIFAVTLAEIALSHSQIESKEHH